MTKNLGQKILQALLIVLSLGGFMHGTKAGAGTVSVVAGDTTINATVGQALNISASATPQDAPTWGQECTVDSGPTYTWSASPGQADNTNSSSTTAHVTFNSPGTYTLTIGCTVSYTSKNCGNYTGSGSATVTVHVGPKYNYSISIAGPGGSNVVAASSGAYSSGSVKLHVTDQSGNPVSGVAAPGLIVTNGTGVNVNASASCSGSSDSNGNITGSYGASDVVGTVTVAVDDGTKNGPSTTVSQHWNDNSSPWTYASTFTYGTASPISYKMTLHAGSDLALTGHQIAFVTVSESGLEWDPNAGPIVGGQPEGDYVNATHSDSDLNEGYYASLVSYSGVSTGSDGTYSTSQTVSWDDNFIIDTVVFDAVDGGTYSSTN